MFEEEKSYQEPKYPYPPKQQLKSVIKISLLDSSQSVSNQSQQISLHEGE